MPSKRLNRKIIEKCPIRSIKLKGMEAANNSNCGFFWQFDLLNVSQDSVLVSVRFC